MQIKTTVRYHLTPLSKRQEITSVGEDVEKWEPSYTVGGISIGVATMESNVEVPQNTKNRNTYDPAILLMGIYLKKTKPPVWKDMFTSVFPGALFTVAKVRKQPKCPSIDEW